MYRIPQSPRLVDIERNPDGFDLWLDVVEDRFNQYTGTNDPLTGDIPEGQWVIFRNITTNKTTFWSKYGGAVSSIPLDSTYYVLVGDKLGYTTGSGGTVTQLTNKSTGVTLNKLSGQITMNGAALASGAKVSFIVTNSLVAATDTPIVAVASGGTARAYRASVTSVGSGSFSITVENITAGSLSESPIINFNLIKGSST